MLAANIGRLRTGLLLPQNPDDLLFREPAWLHVHPLPGDGLYPFLEEVSGLRSAGIRRRLGVPRASSTAAGRRSVSPGNPAGVPDIGEPGLRIDVVELGGGDERVEGRCPPTAFVGAGEGPVTAPDRDGTQLTLSGVVGHAQAAVVEEAGQRSQRLRL